MPARRLYGPIHLQTTGATYSYLLPPMSGYGQVKDIEYMMKVHDVKTPATTAIALIVEQSADGDSSISESHSTPISGAIASVPSLQTGYTDTDANGPLGEWLHLTIRILGGAGEWAVVELFEVKKPF